MELNKLFLIRTPVYGLNIKVLKQGIVYNIKNHSETINIIIFLHCFIFITVFTQLNATPLIVTTLEWCHVQF